MKLFLIEPTNACNARCVFCPHPSKSLHTRPRGYMTWETFTAILERIEGPGVAINGLGEPLLHPRVGAMVGALTDRGIRTQLNTNGRLLDQAMYDCLWAAGLERLVVTTDYFPWGDKRIEERPGLRVGLYKLAAPLEPGHVRKEAHDWGGQWWQADMQAVRCSFLAEPWYAVQWDGTVVRCCNDFNGNYPLGHVTKDLPESAAAPIPICKGCAGYRFRDPLVTGDYDGAASEAAFAAPPIIPQRRTP